MTTVPHWIDGTSSTGAGTARLPVTDPATGAVTAHVALADPSDIDRAVASAAAAYPGWRDTSLSRRTEVMFTFPAMVPLWMLPVAIACGNTFVLEPSEKDPSVSISMAELFGEAGLPPGVLTVLQGDAAAANGLIERPDVHAVSFVGSSPIARHVYETDTSTGKRVQALGGAKNHMIVLPDADLDLAADAAVNAGYGSAGERCMAISVVVAVGSVADRLVPAIAERIDTLRVGPGLSDDAVDMGALVTEAHRDRVRNHVDLGESEGAQLVRVKSYDEALDLVNTNPYGNGTAIFTNDGGAARAFQRDCTVGMVGVNVPIPVPMAYFSFGGWKDSLFGDLHMHGADGVRFYTRSKAVTERWPDPHHRGIDLGFPTTT